MRVNTDALVTIALFAAVVAIGAGVAVVVIIALANADARLASALRRAGIFIITVGSIRKLTDDDTANGIAAILFAGIRVGKDAGRIAKRVEWIRVGRVGLLIGQGQIVATRNAAVEMAVITACACISIVAVGAVGQFAAHTLTIDVAGVVKSTAVVVVTLGIDAFGIGDKDDVACRAVTFALPAVFCEIQARAGAGIF